MDTVADDRRQALEQADQARIEALVSRDIAVLEGLLDPDMRYVHAMGLEDRRPEYLHRIQFGAHTYPEIVAETREIEIFENTGLISGIVRTEVLHSGVQTTRRSRCLQVWNMREGKWKLLRYQSCSLQSQA